MVKPAWAEAAMGIPPSITRDFIGLDTRYATDGGRQVRRHYLDSAATTLMMGSAAELGMAFLAHNANPHTKAHFSARIANETLRWAGETVLELLGADPQTYVALFIGSGATACANRLAFGLAQARPRSTRVFVSLMEHHSNDLPHRRYAQVHHVPLSGSGIVCLASLERLLTLHKGHVNYVALTAASNVTGIINPVNEAAELAHRHGALLVVDGAQAVAHMQIRLSQMDPRREVDAFFFSGHKVYAPGAPGVLVIKRALLASMPPAELGGGIVSDVSESTYSLHEEAELRQQAGTPNMLGIVTLAGALSNLSRLDMARVQAKEQALLRYALSRLDTVPGLKMYGAPPSDEVRRVGCLAFNLQGMGHASVATALNDGHNVAVRNGCFCAHPYVRHLLKKEWHELDLNALEHMDDDAMAHAVSEHQGMVRASLGLYSTQEDIDALVMGLSSLQKQPKAANPHRTFLRTSAQSLSTFDANIHEHSFHPAAAMHRIWSKLSA